MRINVLLSALLLTAAFTVTSCKSHKTITGSNIEVNDPSDVRELTYNAPLTSSTPTTAVTPTTAPTTYYNDVEARTEQITSTEGGTLQAYSVVVGAFGQKTNANNYRTKMANRGYTAFLAQNAKGLWRVVAYTSDNYNNAVTKRNEIRKKYASDDKGTAPAAWILKK